ncbi:MAG: 4Fe-4S binding protein [Firmicutes bacterium]|nr:4Fe-4S binding protein [Bacillota bacterium]
MIRVDKAKCLACGMCVLSCPQEAPQLEGETVAIDAAKCIECGQCIESCPQEALSDE